MSACHAKEYNWWRASGHPYKLRKPAEAKISGLPLPKGYTWADISYVIGGFNWKTSYINKKGYIITTAKDGSAAPTQYNIRIRRWETIILERRRSMTAAAAIPPATPRKEIRAAQTKLLPPQGKLRASLPPFLKESLYRRR
ncbi:MAG: hypothetical protein V3S39_08265 [Thermodesulfobacteriota bacterium]